MALNSKHIILLAFLNTLINSNSVSGCNELVCASIVSKCMLMQSCACSVTACTCCPACLRCLGNFYTECCECVNMCESESESTNITQIFHEDRLDGSPALFQALITEPEPEDNWSVVTFPVRVSKFAAHGGDDNFLGWYGEEDDMMSGGTVNCSVIFLDECTAQTKCRNICESMGAEASLWFQDGCCECAGCPKHSIYENRCLNCPIPDKKDQPMDEYDDFGDGDEGPMYEEMGMEEEYDY